MTRRNNRKKSGAITNNRLISSLIAIIAVIAAAAGIYYLTQSQEASSGEREMKQTSFTERAIVDISSDIDFEEAPDTIPGTVTDSTEEAEKIEETETLVEESAEDEAAENGGVEEPQEDLSSMIANAKNYVYTLYTDLEQGSGFLFNDKGDILTNAHVVKDAAYVTVKNSNGQELNGQVIGISETQDIALVRVPDLAGKQAMEMEMNKVEPGTKVFALGSPENIINTSTEGEIISTGNSFFDEYQYDDLYEMTAKIKQGSSGGPLISAESGKILGINSIVLTDNTDIGYAIPIYTVNDQLEKWAENPLPLQEGAVLPDIKQAHFSEELLRAFLTDYYTLIPYSLNDEEITFYQFFLLPGSQAEKTAQEMLDGLKEENRTFDAVNSEISSVEITDDQAVIHADATFTFHDDVDDKVVSVSHSLVYTIVIDEFGDYQIISIKNQ